MRKTLLAAREYIASDLHKIIENGSIDHTRATIDDDALPFAEAAENLIADIDAALSNDPTDAECTAALNSWFEDFGDIPRRQLSKNATMINRMRCALLAARNAEQIG